MAGSYRVIVSKLADKDIDRIIHQINNRFGKEAAGITYDAIFNKIASLSTMPESNPLYLAENPNDPNTYRWVVAKKVNRIIYTFQEEGGVFVVRIRHVKELPRNVAIALKEEE